MNLRELVSHISKHRENLKTWMLYLLIALAPTQLGTYFFINDSFIFGVRMDYLAISVFSTDIIAFFLIVCFMRWRSVNKLMVFLCIGLCVSAAFSSHPIIGFFKIIKYIELYCVFSILANSYIRDESIATILCITTITECVLCVLQLSHQGTLQGIWYFLGERAMDIRTPGVATSSLLGHTFFRPYGTFSHPNAMGGYFALIFAYVQLNKPSVVNWKKYSIHAFAFCITLMSFSKSALLGLVCVQFIMMIARSRCHLCKISGFIVYGIMAVLVFIAKGDMFALDKRIILALDALQIIIKYPFMGVGPGNYLYAQSTYTHYFPYFFLEPVHNVVLLWIAETGIFINGFVIWKMLRKWHAWPLRQLFPLLCVVGITGMTDHYWLTQQQNLLLLAIIGGLLYRRKG